MWIILLGIIPNHNVFIHESSDDQILYTAYVIVCRGKMFMGQLQYQTVLP